MKEIWLQWFEMAVEDIADEKDISLEDAEKILESILEKDPSYLDGYGVW